MPSGASDSGTPSGTIGAMLNSEWLGHLIRFARRDMDFSQRELARWSGVPKSTIADIEAHVGEVAMATVAKLLSTLGYRMQILDRQGAEVSEFYLEWRRDCVGRLFPAHLDLIPKPPAVLRSQTWLRDFRGMPPPSRWTFQLNRDFRNLRRTVDDYGELGTLPRAPTEPEMEPLRRYVRASSFLSAIAGIPMYADHPSWGP